MLHSGCVCVHCLSLPRFLCCCRLAHNLCSKTDDNIVAGMGLLCPRSGVDLVALCKKNARRGASSGATVSTLVGHPPGAQTKAIPATGAYDKSYMDINVRDCTVLEKVVNSYCAWGTARTDRRGGTASTGVTADVTAASTTTFGREVHKVVKANGG